MVKTLHLTMRSIQLTCIGIIGLVEVTQAQFSNARWIQEHQTWRASGKPSDMDADGDLDMVIFCTNGELAWLQNNGSNVFEQRHSIDSFNSSLGSFEIGDLDGDGDDDIVVSSDGALTLAWSENLGGGQFSSYRTINGPGNYIRGLELGDLDNDGDLEVVAGIFGNPLSFHVFDIAPGSSEFTDLGVIYSTTITVKDVKLCDANLDGDLDLLIAHFGSTGLLQFNGTGDGGFSSAFQALPDSLTITSLVVVDTDEDSDEDLVVRYSGGIGLAENIGGAFGLPALLYTTNDNVTPVAGDVDGDGDMDLVDDEPDAVVWHHNNAGDLSEQSVITSNFFEGVSLFDLDLDGDMEILGGTAAGSYIGFYENLGNGQFDGLSPVGRGVAGAYDQVMADLDGDGRRDLVIASRNDCRLLWYPGHPQKVFEPYIIIDIEATTIECMEVRDDDGDGDLDILAGLGNPGQVVRYENLGGGTFADRVPIADTIYQVNELIAADLDDDGVEELVVEGSDGLYVIERLGPGLYGEATVIDTAGLTTYDMELADLNGDSTLDMITVSFIEHAVHWYANDGSGAFGPRQTITTTAGLVRTVQVRDLDGDGDNDVLTTNNSSHMVWYANNGIGAFTLAGAIDPTSDEVEYLRCEDMDQDGDADILAAYDDGSDQNQTIAWFPNDGAGNFLVRRSFGLEMHWLGRPDLLDLDSDGDRDIFFSESYYPSVRYFENFTIGGARVTGRVFSDENGNGVYDPTEPPVPMVFMASDPNVSSPLTGPDGGYIFFLPQGNFVIAPTDLPEFWGVVSDSAAYHVVVENNTVLIEGLDFGLGPVVDTTVVRPHIDALGAPCGGEALHFLTLVNAGTTIASGVLSYSMDPAYDFEYSTPPPDSVVGTTYFWHFTDLPYLQPWVVTCAVVNPTSAELAGLVQQNYLTVTTLDQQGTAIGTLGATLPNGLQCSYDPNDKAVVPVGWGPLGAIAHDTERLSYTIRFQNIGAGPAFDVRLRDRLSEHLDPASIQITSWSSVPTDLRVEADGELAVVFEDIMLPSIDVDPLASQGFLSFSIAIRTDRPDLAEVLNQAEIHFDHEDGIMTNTTVNTLVDCALMLPSIIELEDGILESSPGTTYQWLLNGAELTGDTLQQLLPGSSGYYSVLVLDQYGCTSVSAQVHVISTTIGEGSGFAVLVQPNLTSGPSRVVLQRPLGDGGTIELADAHGRTIHSWLCTGQGDIAFDATGFAPGMYLLRIREKNVLLGVARFVIR